MSKQIRLRVNDDLFNRVLAFRSHINKRSKDILAFPGVSLSYAIKVAMFNGIIEQPEFKKSTVQKAPNILSFQIDENFYAEISKTSKENELSQADIMRSCLNEGLPSLDWFIDN